MSILKISLQRAGTLDNSRAQRHARMGGTTGDAEMETVNTGVDGEYRPHENEEFMNDNQLRWFESVLNSWREEILRTSGNTLDSLKGASFKDPDMADRAASESDWTNELRTRDRQRKLLAKISTALMRIRDGEYGYCEVTGEPISIARLIARPTASMTLAAQTAHERRERVSRAA